MTGERVELARRTDAGGTFTCDIELMANGSIRVGSFDFGALPSQTRGGDYEEDVFVSPDQLPRLCFALLIEKLMGSLDAASRLQVFCQDRDIAVQSRSWS